DIYYFVPDLFRIFGGEYERGAFDASVVECKIKAVPTINRHFHQSLNLIGLSYIRLNETSVTTLLLNELDRFFTLGGAASANDHAHTFGRKGQPSGSANS